MLSGEKMIDYQFLIELGASFAFAAFLWSKLTDYLKSRTNAIARNNKLGQANFGGISALISNIDSILEQQHKLRQKQIEAGATPEALKPLDQQISRLEWVRSNQGWLQYIGPYGDQIVNGLMRIATRVLK